MCSTLRETQSWLLKAQAAAAIATLAEKAGTECVVVCVDRYSMYVRVQMCGGYKVYRCAAVIHAVQFDYSDMNHHHNGRTSPLNYRHKLNHALSKA